MNRVSLEVALLQRALVAAQVACYEYLDACIADDAAIKALETCAAEIAKRVKAVKKAERS